LLLAAFAASRLVGLHSPAGPFVDENLAHVLGDVRRAGRKARPTVVPRPRRPGVRDALVVPWAGENTLWASRCLTVAFGALTLLAILALARRLYDEPTALVAGGLYVLCR